ncbi:hypothetical protein QVD17_21820 [Tagetes erecta]|uniref:Uncharacterized protein n=1 Tax=Tagetes erecta TaxID=13708 RepID=A0AAD8NTP7_TARER|nr:hypothetical protein QVD17_21820 [Tagetes erecta]
MHRLSLFLNDKYHILWSYIGLLQRPHATKLAKLETCCVATTVIVLTQQTVEDTTVIANKVTQGTPTSPVDAKINEETSVSIVRRTQIIIVKRARLVYIHMGVTSVHPHVVTQRMLQ